MAVIGLFGARCVFSQDLSASDVDSAPARSVISQTDESLIPINAPSGQTDVPGSARGSAGGLWVFIRMILVLALVVVIIWFVLKIMRKNTPGAATNDPFLRNVATLALSPGKSVHVVTLIDRAYVLGVGEDSVTLLDTINGKDGSPDQELVQDFNVYADRTDGVRRPGSFADILEIFMGKKSSEERQGTAYDRSTSRILDSLKHKRVEGEEE